MAKNIFGSDINNIYLKISNDFIRNKNSKFYFKPNNEGQLDFWIYISLMKTVSITNSFTVSIDMLVYELGYKSNPRAGKINSKILESFNRLENKNLIEIKFNDGKFISGTMIFSNTDNNYFLIKLNNIQKIMDNQLEKLYNEDYSNKYKNKVKDLYIYSYINSHIGTHETTEPGVKFNGCYLTLENICKNCNVSRNYLMKILTYFEIDNIMFTANIGFLKTNNGSFQKGVNYYTTNFDNLNTSYIYAKAYADKEGFKYNKYYKRTNDMLNEITDLLIKIDKELKLKNGENTVKNFKFSFGLMLRDTLNNAINLYPDIKINKIDKFIIEKKYLESKFYDKDTKNRNKYLIYIAENETSSEVLLNHIKNKTKALAYMNGVI